MLKPKLFSIVKHKEIELSKSQLIKDVISGVIVATIALPLSIALAIASGVTPERGMITAIVAGFLISFLGGSRVQIGGPTGAFVVIISGIIHQYGMEGLAIATLMAGGFMILFGLLRIGSVIAYIPYSITIGFTFGIGVVLFSTQINDLFGLGITQGSSEFLVKWREYLSAITQINWLTLGIGIMAIIILLFWSKVNQTIPGSMVALVVTTFIVQWFHLPVETIGTRFGELSTKIQFLDFSQISLNPEMVKDLLSPAITIAFLASIESLLSAVVADKMIGKKHNSNMELIAQGVANIGSTLVGGIPATGAIARTAANVKNGGRTPVAGITHAIILALMMLCFMPFAKMIPMTTLAAILMIVSIHMCEVSAVKEIISKRKSDLFVLGITFLCTILFDLVVAIEMGIVVALLFSGMRKIKEQKSKNDRF